MTKSQLLTQDALKKLTSLRLTSKSKIRGQHKGSHRSGRAGTSMDFSDYRAYHLGDDVRQIDWNVYARSEKYFIKRFLDEQEMSVHIVLDGTKSMCTPLSKWQLAKQLTAALGYLVLQHDDRLQCTYITEVDTVPFRQKGSAAKPRLIHTVEKFSEPIMKSSFCEKASKYLVKGQTILIIITDALEPIEQLEHFIRRLPNYAGDIRLIQLVERDIHAPSYIGDIELFDSESEKLVNVTMTDAILKSYFDAKAAHEKQLDALCKKYGVAHVQLLVDEGFQQSMFYRLKKANWIE